MPNLHVGRPLGPDEGQYDVRKGAAAYAPIVGSFGSLVVTAIVVVFTLLPSDTDGTLVTLCSGLLAVGFVGSVLGAFGLAAVGAENDPTANLGPAMLFIAAPVVVSLVAILGGLQVLAAVYVPHSADRFLAIAGICGVFGVVFACFSIADSHHLHPTTMSEAQFENWADRQWLKDRAHAIRVTYAVILVCLIPAMAGFLLRFVFGLSVPLSHAVAQWFVLGSIVIVLAGVGFSLAFTNHPKSGNDQRGLRPWHAWTPNIVLGVYTLAVLLVLP